MVQESKAMRQQAGEPPAHTHPQATRDANPCGLQQAVHDSARKKYVKSFLFPVYTNETLLHARYASCLFVRYVRSPFPVSPHARTCFSGVPSQAFAWMCRNSPRRQAPGLLYTTVTCTNGGATAQPHTCFRVTVPTSLSRKTQIEFDAASGVIQ